MTEASLLDHPWITRWKLDVHEYHRLGETGILTEEDRVELIEGEVVEMSPIGAAHAGKVNRLNRLFGRLVGDRAVVALQNPIQLSDRTEPQPDVALLRPRADFYEAAAPTPADILLLVEVADSSLRFDRLVKLPLYARHGIPEVWIVDLAANVVEVHRGPTAAGYAEATTLGRGAVLRPLPGTELRVDDILG